VSKIKKGLNQIQIYR